MATEPVVDEVTVQRHLGGPLGGDYCEKHGVLPVQETESTVVVCFDHTPDPLVLEELQFLTGKQIVVGGIIPGSLIAHYLKKFRPKAWFHRQLDP